ncbi:MAG: VRR-NUC domain-containing protein [Candidatus Doudnabacteria bacterium]
MKNSKYKVVDDKLVIKQTANDLTDAIVTYLNLQGHFVWRQNNGGVFDPTKKIFRKNPKQKKGVPDICGISKHGYGLYIEVKTGKDKLSEEQKEFAKSVAARGGIWIVARSIDNVINFPL